MSSSPMHLTGPDQGKPEREGLAFVPILIVLLVVALVAVTAYQVLAPHPVASVAIEKVNAVEMPPGDRVVVEAELALHNDTDKPLKYHSTEMRLVAGDKEFKDEPAPSPEVPRIYFSYPALKQSSEPPLKQDLVIEPGATVRGVVIVAYPVNKAGFDARKDLQASVFFYDQAPVRSKTK